RVRAVPGPGPDRPDGRGGPRRGAWPSSRRPGRVGRSVHHRDPTRPRPLARASSGPGAAGSFTLRSMPYQPHHVFHAPAPNAPLLRYLDFEKFVWLLDHQALYFARADRLGDRFEGSMSRANLAAREQSHPKTLWGLGPDQVQQLEATRRALLLQTFVNCWTRSSYESVAMWRLYVGQGNGVAIQSTFTRLRDAVGDEPRPVFIGKVEYLDYDRDVIPERNTFYPFMRKRRSFEYEREVRALATWPVVEDGRPRTPGEIEVIDLAAAPEGLEVRVDISRLILR